MQYKFWLTGLTVLLGAVILSGGGIDNSKLLPPLLDDSQVKLEQPRPDATATPDWVKTLIIVEAAPEQTFAGGTFAGAEKILDHVAEMGANAIWLTPINETRHYWNNGLHTLNSKLTGTTDVPEQWRRVKAFVDSAHKRNIRVFLDVVSWGVQKNAPLVRERPDFFSGEFIKQYNGWAYNWRNPALREWFAARLVELVLMTGADGIRCDCAPGYCGYAPFRMARQRLLDFGRKVVFISEHASERRGVFDFDQAALMYRGQKDVTGLSHPSRAFIKNNIVDVVKSGAMMGSVDSRLQGCGTDYDGGRERYYTFPLSCHDNNAARTPIQDMSSNGNPVIFGYQALFSPYIPLWLIGDEWINPVETKGWMWANPVRWELLEQPENRAFFELVKKMIRIRRLNPEIFEYFPDDHRDSNIAKVATDRSDLLQAYARYANGRAILIVPNNLKEELKLKVSVPYQATGVTAPRVVIRDLLNDRELASGPAAGLSSFDVTLPGETLGVYEVAPAQ